MPVNLCGWAADWQTHCYQTDMRFGSGPGAIVCRVQWYRTSLPFIPFPTVYNSHIWMDDSKEWFAMYDGGWPGEIWGAPRPRVPMADWLPGGNCVGPEGSAEAWLGQYRPGEDPLYDVEAFPCDVGEFSTEEFDDSFNVGCTFDDMLMGEAEGAELIEGEE